MKTLLKLESIAFLILGLYAYYTTGVSWWWIALFWLAPDLSMIGYLLNPKLGAVLYNLFHHYAIPVLAYLIGLSSDSNWITVASSIWFTHIAVDRIFGFGLKYKDRFKHTHLDDL